MTGTPNTRKVPGNETLEAWTRGRFHAETAWTEGPGTATINELLCSKYKGCIVFGGTPPRKS